MRFIRFLPQANALFMSIAARLRKGNKEIKPARSSVGSMKLTNGTFWILQKKGVKLRDRKGRSIQWFDIVVLPRIVCRGEVL